MPDFLIRGIPKGVYGLLKDAAEQNQRSLNKEIIARLEASLFKRRLPPDEFLRRMAEHRAAFRGTTTIEEMDAFKREGRE